MTLGLAVPTSGQALLFGHPFAELERPATRVSTDHQCGMGPDGLESGPT
jgi:hypothetical protein